MIHNLCCLFQATARFILLPILILWLRHPLPPLAPIPPRLYPTTPKTQNRYHPPPKKPILQTILSRPYHQCFRISRGRGGGYGWFLVWVWREGKPWCWSVPGVGDAVRGEDIHSDDIDEEKILSWQRRSAGMGKKGEKLQPAKNIQRY